MEIMTGSRTYGAPNAADVRATPGAPYARYAPARPEPARTNAPPEVRVRNPDSTSAPSRSSHSRCRNCHIRSACPSVRLSPGISRYSFRIRRARRSNVSAATLSVRAAIDAGALPARADETSLISVLFMNPPYRHQPHATMRNRQVPDVSAHPTNDNGRYMMCNVTNVQQTVA